MGLFDPSASMFAVRDKYFAPCVLAPFAEDMARRLARLTNGPVLEIMSNTGTLTQAMAASLSAGMTIVATDPDPAAVAHASARPGMGRISWQTADPSAALPFNDATFRVVACLFAISTLPDRVAAFREVRRVMKADARFLFSVPGHIRHNPVADCIQAALDAIAPDDPPGFIGQRKHGYSDSEAIDNDLTAAGFTDAIYTTVAVPFAAASAREAAIGYCLGTRLRDDIESRFPLAVDTVTGALEQRFGTGRIVSAMRAHVVTAAG
jgi:SAM-dependent methyltransferase